MSKAEHPPTNYPQLVQQAVLHAQLLARLTENFLSAGDGDQGVVAGKELSAALDEAAPAIKRALEWWPISQPPGEPPAAASYFHWTYRRGRAALAHAFAAIGDWRAWDSLTTRWPSARALMREHVGHVDFAWLDVRLLAESQVTKPAKVCFKVADASLHDELDAWEHALDAKDPPPDLELIAGGFTYRGKTNELTGRPLAMLAALLGATHRRLTGYELREQMGIDDARVEFPEQVVRDTATVLRKALLCAVHQAGETCENPLPSTGRGGALTYSLAVP